MTGRGIGWERPPLFSAAAAVGGRVRLSEYCNDIVKLYAVALIYATVKFHFQNFLCLMESGLGVSVFTGVG